MLRKGYYVITVKDDVYQRLEELSKMYSTTVPGLVKAMVKNHQNYFIRNI